MRKILLMNIFLGVSAFGYIGCALSSTNANKPLLNANTNTAVVINSNTNTATINANANSNMNSTMNSNVSSNASKTVSGSDKEFMDKASQGGMTESQLGNLAIMKAQSDEVKAFGQKMINDHSKANTDLRDLAKQKGVELPPTMSMEQTRGMSDLAKLSGAAFDKEYVKQMVGDHEKDVADFQRQANTGIDADVKKFAADNLPTLKMHLEMIKAIQSKMK